MPAPNRELGHLTLKSTRLRGPSTDTADTSCPGGRRRRYISRKILRRDQRFRGLIMDWSDISERAYLNGRRLA